MELREDLKQQAPRNGQGERRGTIPVAMPARGASQMRRICCAQSGSMNQRERCQERGCGMSESRGRWNAAGLKASKEGVASPAVDRAYGCGNSAKQEGAGDRGWGEDRTARRLDRAMRCDMSLSSSAQKPAPCIWLFSDVSGTYLTPVTRVRVIFPCSSLSMASRCWSPPAGPTGITSRPPGAN